jgi:2-polyprenyl-6-methoxyphenol hydroxylase-like FAD-dependent oxidoreductase
MASTVIVGGSVAGLATALALAQAGYDARILERDPVEPPASVEQAHHAWRRPTVPQATHSHAFASLGVNLLHDRAPAVYAALVEAGAAEIALADRMPPTLPDRSRRPGDDQLRMLGCRRSTFELVLRRVVLGHPRVSLVPGATVRGLEMATRGAPRVVGVRLADGRTVRADLVVDATGRRSTLDRWLADGGVLAPPGKVDSCDISYYTRFYRLLAERPPGPLNRGFGAGGLWDHYTAVLFLGDNRSFSVSVGVLPDDPPMKALRHEAAFTAALRATPLLSPWLAPGVAEPISDVYAMGGLDNSLRGPAAPGWPRVLGLHAVGDSVCTTNPAYGRGVSLALANAYLLADLLTANPDVSAAQADEVAAATARLFAPWFAESVQNDRGRAGMWRSTVHGGDGGGSAGPPPGVLTFGMAAEAAALDAVVWRRLVRVMMSLDPPSTLYADDEVRERVLAVLASNAVPHVPAPSRQQLLTSVTAAA